MSKVYGFVIFLLLASSAWGVSPAENLFHALQSSGAHLECEESSCHVSAENVRCQFQRSGRSAGTHDCSLTAENFIGATVQMKTKGSTATALYSTMQSFGPLPECSRRLCVIEVAQVICETSPSGELQRYECQVKK